MARIERGPVLGVIVAVLLATGAARVAVAAEEAPAPAPKQPGAGGVDDAPSRGEGPAGEEGGGEAPARRRKPPPAVPGAPKGLPYRPPGAPAPEAPPEKSAASSPASAEPGASPEKSVAPSSASGSAAAGASSPPSPAPARAGGAGSGAGASGGAVAGAGAVGAGASRPSGGAVSGGAGESSGVGADKPPEEAAPISHDGAFLSFELSAGLNVNGRLPATDAPSQSDDAADVLLGMAAQLTFDGRWAIGLGYARVGYGKERYAVSTDAETLNVAYALDTFWALGRYYFSAERPALYAGLGLGAGLAQARATGAVADEALLTSSVPFECSDTGTLGFGGLLAVGAEVDLSDALSMTTELAGTAHLMDDAPDAHGRCGRGAGLAVPGAGPSLQGALRLGFAYRLPL